MHVTVSPVSVGQGIPDLGAAVIPAQVENCASPEKGIVRPSHYSPFQERLLLVTFENLVEELAGRFDVREGWRAPVPHYLWIRVDREEGIEILGGNSP